MNAHQRRTKRRHAKRYRAMRDAMWSRGPISAPPVRLFISEQTGDNYVDLVWTEVGGFTEGTDK